LINWSDPKAKSGRARNKPHVWRRYGHKKHPQPWVCCAFCGLINLNNEASGREARKLCQGKDE